MAGWTVEEGHCIVRVVGVDRLMYFRRDHSLGWDSLKIHWWETSSQLLLPKGYSGVSPWPGSLPPVVILRFGFVVENRCHPTSAHIARRPL